MKNMFNVECVIMQKDGVITEPAGLAWEEIYEGFVAGPFESDWPYYLFITVTDMQDACGEPGYMVEIQAASPKAAGMKNLKSAVESCGEENTNIKKLTQVQRAELLKQYGISAHLWIKWDKSAKDPDKLVEEAKKEATAIPMMFGFYMDRVQNRIGNTGWDFIKGDIGFK